MIWSTADSQEHRAVSTRTEVRSRPLWLPLTDPKSPERYDYIKVIMYIIQDTILFSSEVF